MKGHNIIDIIERSQTRHALQEERELKNFDASPPGDPEISRNRRNSVMNGIIEADFFPPAVAEAIEKPRILIIDNNRDFTLSAKLGLERTGRYAVWEENDPTRAHQTAQRVKPDLILLDIAMPETDGGEVAARIDSDPTLHRTPVVFLTALVTRTEARSGLQIQGHRFLAKPIRIPELIAGIERSLPAHVASHGGELSEIK
jgi:CheY-like chemotaxis protein